MPFRNLASHTYTSVLSLRIVDEDACAAAHLEWGRRSKPEIEGEETVMKTKYAEMRVENAPHLPDPAGVQRSQVSQMLHFQVNYKDLQAYHDIRDVVEANAGGDIQEADGLGNVTYHEVHMVNMEGRSGSKPQYLDLQEPRS